MRVAVFFDQRFTNSASLTGVGYHIVNMTQGLRNSGINVVALHTADQTVSQTHFANIECRVIPLKWRAAELRWLIGNGPLMSDFLADVDLIYCPKNDFIPVAGKRVITTIHGAHELDPHYVGPKNSGIMEALRRYKSALNYSRICQRSDTIVTVSNWLKSFVMSRFGVSGEKVRVVGNGISPIFYETGRKAFTFNPDEKSDILCVGGLNHIDGGDYILHLVEAIERFELPFRVNVAGAAHCSKLLADAKRFRNLTLLGHLTHYELASLMASSCALYYPTRYETFGMAAAEAMAAGCPVISSNLPPLTEVLGSCGIYVDPNQLTSVLDNLTMLREDTTYRNNLVRKGREASLHFSWDKCVERLIRIFEE